jgi:hypothetical protein
MKLSQSHDLSYEFCKLIWVDLDQFIVFFLDLFFFPISSLNNEFIGN